MNINFIVDKQYETKSLQEILNSPISVLQGLSENDAKLLADAFNVKTVGDLAKNKFFKAAQAIQLLAEREQDS